MFISSSIRQSYFRDLKKKWTYSIIFTFKLLNLAEKFIIFVLVVLLFCFGLVWFCWGLQFLTHTPHYPQPLITFCHPLPLLLKFFLFPTSTPLAFLCFVCNKGLLQVILAIVCLWLQQSHHIQNPAFQSTPPHSPAPVVSLLTAPQCSLGLRQVMPMPHLEMSTRKPLTFNTSMSNEPLLWPPSTNH